MRAVDAAAVAPGTVSGHRAGSISFRRLLQGVPGSPGNFEASVVTAGADYYTPRHRHTFDQVRWVLDGTFTWATREDLDPGDVLYVPEGTWYGPQRLTGESTVFLLQYGGAGGAGFLSYDQLDAGHRELAARGRFERGIFHPAEGGRGVDGYEAIHRHVTGRAVEYPPARYRHPVVVHPDAFGGGGRGSGDSSGGGGRGGAGLEVVPLGSFGELGHGFALVRMAAGADYAAPAAPATRVLFVVRGAVRLGDGVLGAHSALALEPDEALDGLEAVEASELFVTTLHAHPPG